MSGRSRLVLDTNVVISALLWQGNPGLLIEASGDGDVQLFSSRLLLDELRATLEKPKLTNAVRATGFTTSDMLVTYRQLVTIVRPKALDAPTSRDPDDDHVIACAIAARADGVVTGDDDLLALKKVAGIPVRSVSEMLAALRGAGQDPRR